MRRTFLFHLGIVLLSGAWLSIGIVIISVIFTAMMNSRGSQRFWSWEKSWGGFTIPVGHIVMDVYWLPEVVDFALWCFLVVPLYLLWRSLYARQQSAKEGLDHAA
jgi:hypothetical protein